MRRGTDDGEIGRMGEVWEGSRRREFEACIVREWMARLVGWCGLGTRWETQIRYSDASKR